VIDIPLGLALIALAVASIMQSRRLRATQKLLDRVRFASVDLINTLQDDIGDLEDTLKGMRIPMVTTRRDERTRRMMLSPQERYDESVARWEEVVARSERLWKDSSD